MDARTCHKLNLKWSLFLLAAMSFNLWAEDNSTQQSAHVHGYLELTLALEGNWLEIDLQSPAANIVGFEHEATTAEQKQLVKNAKKLLKDTDRLFLISGVSCKSKKIDIDMSGLEGAEHDHGHHDHHDAHDHQDMHDVHSEIKVHYRFKCKNTDNITDVTINLFEDFPAIEKIEVQWVTHAKQGAVELKALSNQINLR